MCEGTGKTHKLYLNTSLMGQTVNLNTELIYILKYGGRLQEEGKCPFRGRFPLFVNSGNKTTVLAIRRRSWLPEVAAVQRPLEIHNFHNVPQGRGRRDESPANTQLKHEGPFIPPLRIRGVFAWDWCRGNSAQRVQLETEGRYTFGWKGTHSPSPPCHLSSKQWASVDCVVVILVW